MEKISLDRPIAGSETSIEERQKLQRSPREGVEQQRSRSEHSGPSAESVRISETLNNRLKAALRAAGEGGDFTSAEIRRLVDVQAEVIRDGGREVLEAHGNVDRDAVRATTRTRGPE